MLHRDKIDEIEHTDIPNRPETGLTCSVCIGETSTDKNVKKGIISDDYCTHCDGTGIEPMER